MNRHFGLVVLCGGEDLALLAGDGGVGVNQLGHHATESFNAQGEGSYVKEHDVTHTFFFVQDGTLDGCTDSDHFVGVHALGRSFAEEFLHEFLHGGNTGGAADEDDFVNVRGGETCALEGCFARSFAGFDERVSQGFELGASQRLHQVFGHTADGHDVGQIDFGGGGAGKFNLCFLGSFLESLHRHRVGGQVCAFVVFELLHEPVDDDVVKVVTAEVSVTVGGEHFEDTATKFKDRDIKRTATEVEDCNLHVFVGFVDAVGECGGSRFVDDSLDIETCDLSGFFGCLTLRVAEVGGHGDDSFGHFLSEVVFGCFLHFLKNHGGDFLGRILTSVNFDTGCVVFAAHDGVGHA